MATHVDFGSLTYGKRRDNETQQKLPVLVRFRDLRAANIIANWPALQRLIADEGFPQGVRLSPNIRAWRVDEIERWLLARPVERKRVPNRWALRDEAGNS